MDLLPDLTIEVMPDEPARRAYQMAMHCRQNGFYARYGNDTIQLEPPLVVEKTHIHMIVEAVGEAICALN